MPYDDNNEPNPWYIYDYLFYFSPGTPEDSKYPFGIVYEWHLFEDATDPTYIYGFLQRHKDFLTQFGYEFIDEVTWEVASGGYTFSDAQEDFQFLLQTILDYITLFAQGTWVKRDVPVSRDECFMACGLFYSLSCRLDHVFDLLFQWYKIDVHQLHVSPFDTPRDLSDLDVPIVQAILHFRRMRKAVLNYYQLENAMNAFFREDWCYFYGYWTE